MILKSILLPIFLFLIGGCSYPSADEVKVDYSTPIITTENENAGIQISDLFVFVGEKIEVAEFRPGPDSMDQAFKAKYRVVEKVYGEFTGNVIEFEVYDHYGIPPFSKFKHVLLFVSKAKGKLYHEKYQYFDVYQTVEGRWASCGDPYRFDEYHRKDFTAQKLEFDPPIMLVRQKPSEDETNEIYPAPYFSMQPNKAKCLMGAYVEDLFLVKKNGVLKARGLF